MSTTPNTPNSPLSEAVKGLPSLLDTLRSALESDADNQLQSKAFGLGCELLKNLVDSIAHDLSRIDDVRSGFSISIPKDSFDRFIADEIRLLKEFRFSEQDLKDVEDGLSSLKDEKDELDTFHFVSSKALATLQEFRDLLCQLEDLAKKESIPNAKELILTCISGVWQVAVISGNVAAGVVAIPTGWAAIPTLLLSIESVRVGWFSLNKTLPKLRELINNERVRRRLGILKRNAPKRPLLKKRDDKK